MVLIFSQSGECALSRATAKKSRRVICGTFCFTGNLLLRSQRCALYPEQQRKTPSAMAGFLLL